MKKAQIILAVMLVLNISSYSLEKNLANYIAQEGAALERESYELAKSQGREAAVESIREFMETYPEYENKIQLEASIAQLYFMKFEELQNDPPDDLKAIAVYDSILKRYDRTDPYMITIKLLLADRCTTLFPEKTKIIYEDLMRDYPDQVHIQLECLLQLGRQAQRVFLHVKAEENFAKVIKFDPATMEELPKELGSISRSKQNAAIAMIDLCVKLHRYLPDTMKEDGYDAYRKKYPEMELAYMKINVPKDGEALPAFPLLLPEKPMDVVDSGANKSPSDSQ